MREILPLHVAILSLNTVRSVAKIDELERNIQNFAIRTLRFARKFSTWNSLPHAEGAHLPSCMVEQPRYVPFVAFPRKQCYEAKKWRWSILWTISSHRDQLENIISRILRCWMQDCEKDHLEFVLQEVSQPGGAKGPNGRPTSSWQTHCVHDL